MNVDVKLAIRTVMAACYSLAQGWALIVDDFAPSLLVVHRRWLALPVWGLSFTIVGVILASAMVVQPRRVRVAWWVWATHATIWAAGWWVAFFTGGLSGSTALASYTLFAGLAATVAWDHTSAVGGRGKGAVNAASVQT